MTDSGQSDTDSRPVEIYCECGALLDSDIEPGACVVAPTCDTCETKFEWPTKDVLLAVYGAPYNWPVAA
jgi:hypothetical protein